MARPVEGGWSGPHPRRTRAAAIDTRPRICPDQGFPPAVGGNPRAADPAPGRPWVDTAPGRREVSALVNHQPERRTTTSDRPLAFALPPNGVVSGKGVQARGGDPAPFGSPPAPRTFAFCSVARCGTSSCADQTSAPGPQTLPRQVNGQPPHDLSLTPARAVSGAIRPDGYACRSWRTPSRIFSISASWASRCIWMSMDVCRTASESS